ncbi:MAG: hypothetical protein FWG11_07950 [Promicromonosporaceae bacterium]|nr:hypothetical protein [Promicromonosporaceae bacterium]
MRASTPTDAAKRIVPDVARERLSISSARRSMVSLLEARLQREQLSLSSLRTRPVLAHPQTMVDIREERLGHTIARARTLLNEQLLQACGDIGRLSAELNALSPASTLERGYAVVQTAAGVVVRTAKDAPAGTALTIRLAKDTLPAVVSD